MKKMLMLFAAAGLLSGPANAATQKTSTKTSAAVVKVTAPKESPKTQATGVKVEKIKVAPRTADTPVKKAAVKKQPGSGYDIIQIGLWFNQPSETRYTDVYGVKVGAPICSGDGFVSGIETAVICGATRQVNGLSACILWSDVKEMNGIQFSIVNIAGKVSGFQLGIFNQANDSSLQIGIVNMNKKGFLPCFPVLNFSI